MGVSQETIAKLKGLPISDVLSKDGVTLKRVGREFVTQCLWHEDRNPSLTVSDDKGFVFCHVCQHSDDAIGYIQKKYGINFSDACNKIAASNSIEIKFTNEDPHEAARLKAEKKAAYDQVAKSHVEFRANLNKHHEVISFIQSRNIKPETSRHFELGYDTSSKRLTIPISDYLGNRVGFTSRTILPDVKPKYKNSENNVIFNKNNIVFNEYRATEYIRSNDECIFVEGHLDVINLWQAGVKNVVALQGTASPPPHVLKRLMNKTKRFVLCMDSDAGGIKAISKFLDSVQRFTLSGELAVRIAVLPEGMDPDDFIQSGGNFNSLIHNAQSWLDWLLDQWLDTIDFSDELKIQQVEKHIKELFSQISSQALRSHYYDKASIRLAQNKQDIAAQIAKGFHEHESPQLTIKTWQRPKREFTRKLVEKRMLRLYIHKPEYRWILEPLMDRLYFPQMKWLWRRLQEIREFAGDNFCKDHVLAILCVAEPIYMQTLRSTVNPSVSINDNEMSIAHIEAIMMQDLDPAVEM